MVSHFTSMEYIFTGGMNSIGLMLTIPGSIPLSSTTSIMQFQLRIFHSIQAFVLSCGISCLAQFIRRSASAASVRSRKARELEKYMKGLRSLIIHRS